MWLKCYQFKNWSAQSEDVGGLRKLPLVQNFSSQVPGIALNEVIVVGLQNEEVVLNNYWIGLVIHTVQIMTPPPCLIYYLFKIYPYILLHLYTEHVYGSLLCTDKEAQCVLIKYPDNVRITRPPPLYR